MIGEKFERWTVLEDRGEKLLTKCDCGNVKETTKRNVFQGKSKSCGCINRERLSARNRTHGLTSHPLYAVWGSMIQRCTNPKEDAWVNYGGRGITVCDEWLNSFEQFHKWGIGGYRKGLQLDRIDNNKNYSPENCRWVTRKINARNKRTNHLVTIDGKTKTVIEWAEDTGIMYRTILTRLNKGWSGTDLIQPLLKQGKPRKLGG